MDEKRVENEAGWKYQPADDAGPEVPADEVVAAASGAESAEIAWSASEFVAHHKPAGWYLALAVVTAAIAAAVYWASRDYIATGAIVAVGIIFGVIGSRKPRELAYKLDGRGLSVEGKLYPFAHFKAFWVARDGALASISLLPLKRFMPVLTVYFDPADEDKITSFIGDRLPLASHQLDPIDRFLKKIRF